MPRLLTSAQFDPSVYPSSLFLDPAEKYKLYWRHDDADDTMQFAVEVETTGDSCPFVAESSTKFWWFQLFWKNVTPVSRAYGEWVQKRFCEGVGECVVHCFCRLPTRWKGWLFRKFSLFSDFTQRGFQNFHSLQKRHRDVNSASTRDHQHKSSTSTHDH